MSSLVFECLYPVENIFSPFSVFRGYAFCVVDLFVEVADIVDHIGVLEQIEDGKFEVVISFLGNVIGIELMFEEWEDEMSVHASY